MKILVVHNQYQISGGEDRVVENESRLLQSHGHQIQFFKKDNHSISGVQARLKTFWEVSYSEDSRKEMATTLQAFRPDLVHVHNFFPLITPSVYDACIEARVPVVQTLHNYRTLCANSLFLRDGKNCEDCLHSGPYNAVLHRCYRNSTVGSFAVARMIQIHKKTGTWQNKVSRFIALSRFSKQKFIEGGFPENKISVKPNFVSEENISKEKKPDSGFNAFFMGRLSGEKGIPTLIEAWRVFLKRFPSAVLRIAGEGPEKPVVEKAARDFPQNIFYLGFLNSAAIQKNLKNADVLVLPSECYENFPLALVEAYAAGIPVVASKLGAMAELLNDGIQGLQFEVRNPGHLSERLSELASNPELLQRLSEGARQTFLEKYTASRNYDELMKIYSLAQHTSPEATLNV